MQLLEAPQKPQPLLQPPYAAADAPAPAEIAHALSTVEMAHNLTPEAQKILSDVALRNPKIAEITADTAERLH